MLELLTFVMFIKFVVFCACQQRDNFPTTVSHGFSSWYNTGNCEAGQVLRYCRVHIILSMLHFSIEIETIFHKFLKATINMFKSS